MAKIRITGSGVRRFLEELLGDPLGGTQVPTVESPAAPEEDDEAEAVGGSVAAPLLIGLGGAVALGVGYLLGGRRRRR